MKNVTGKEKTPRKKSFILWFFAVIFALVVLNILLPEDKGHKKINTEVLEMLLESSNPMTVKRILDQDYDYQVRANNVFETRERVNPKSPISIISIWKNPPFIDVITLATIDENLFSSLQKQLKEKADSSFVWDDGFSKDCMKYLIKDYECWACVPNYKKEWEKKSAAEGYEISINKLSKEQMDRYYSETSDPLNGKI